MLSPVKAGLDSATFCGVALVVDDDTTTRLVLAAQLRGQGYAVVLAADGREAIASFERLQPGIVFLDVMLPDLDGYEVARTIKRLSGERFVPVLFLTGLSEQQALTACIEAGGDDFLSKPVDFVTLRARILAIERIRGLYENLRAQRQELADLYGRMEFEQSIAEQVFNDFVMASNVSIPPIRRWLKSASVFNGDLFLSCHAPGGGIAVLLGDFTGHGLAAAIGALPTSETFRTMTAKGFTLIDVMAEINRKLNRLLPTGIFLAASALRIDPDLKTALAWNSGMPEMILCREDGSRRMIASHHPPLGVLSDFMPGTQPERIVLVHGDVFVMCSDGLTEACNEQGEAFGEARFLAQLEASRGMDAFERLQTALTGFTGSAEQRDDISLVVMPCCEGLLAGAGHAGEVAAPRHPSDPWEWSLRLEGANLKRVDPVPLAMHHLESFGIPPRHLQQIYVIVMELFSNALDHGVLGLDSAMKNSDDGFMAYYTQRQQKLEQLQTGFVAIRFDYRLQGAVGVLLISIEDSGKGFCRGLCAHCDAVGERSDENLRLEHALSDPELLAGGRGVRLIRSLCRSVRYRGAGNRVEAEYLL
ncbi:SpoIIE family protein phosphatase [Uliginosibacterium paludis]|uniref:SpoIIE family protein phosphatase n=1 Tax=Uliginosibacterium paludis TaxID=1615952 RepID=A0ABV2CVW6_9RHOO